MKERMRSSHHVLYGLGYTGATMALTIRSKEVTQSKSRKSVLVQIADCNSSA